MNSEKSEDLEERLGFLNKEFLESLYRNICRSLFESDKLLLSALLCLKLMEMKNEIDMALFKFFLTGGVSIGEILPQNPTDWLSEKQWGELNRLGKFKEFKGIVEEFIENHQYYRGMYDSTSPQLFELRDKWKNMNKFEFLCFMRCLRPDMLIPAIALWVTSYIGEYFITPPQFDLGLVFKDSSATVPLIFVLSPGADPLNNLEKYAESKKKHVDKVSLG